MERVPESIILERESKDIDFYLGRVVRIDDDFAIVNISGSLSRNIKNRTPIFYVLDEKMRAVALLEDASITYKTCATFKVVSGKANRGDMVMVKYIAPNRKKELENTQNSPAGNLNNAEQVK